MARRGSLSEEAQDLKRAQADHVAQERGPADARVHVLAPAYLQAVHPDTGLDVVFVPGEALPAWVVDVLHTAVEVDVDGPPVLRIPS